MLSRLMLFFAMLLFGEGLAVRRICPRLYMITVFRCMVVAEECASEGIQVTGYLGTMLREFEGVYLYIIHAREVPQCCARSRAHPIKLHFVTKSCLNEVGSDVP